MKIILCRTNKRIENQIKKVLEQEAIEVFEFEETLKEANYEIGYMQKLLEVCSKESPQMVWSMEFIPIVSRVCQMLNILYISWVTEKIYDTLYSETVEAPINYIFIAEKSIYEKTKELNPGHIFYMPPGVFNDGIEEKKGVLLTLSKEKQQKYLMRQDGSGYLWGYIKGITETQKKIYGVSIIEKLITKEIEEEFKETVYRGGIGSDYKEEPIKYLIDDFISDTLTEIEKEEIKEKTKADFIQEGDIEKIGEINIYSTSRKWKKGLPFEAIDIMAAGGFLIINYQDEIEEYFVIDEELVVFEDFEDLEKKIIYYKEHEEERKQIAKKGQEAVKERFALLERLEDMFYILENALGEE